MSEPPKQRFTNHKWIPATITFSITVIFLFSLTTWNPYIGVLTSLLLFASVFVGSYLRLKFNYNPSEDNSNDYLKPLPAHQLKNSQNLLRYATAVLSFLSLTTTAQGMIGFVFKKDWMAYMGSFAVQAILVTFSLLLCRFYVQISCSSWPPAVKYLARNSMILFFSIALSISSLFSFTYIANKAYESSRISDSDTTIRSYLITTVDKLDSENEAIGHALLNCIDSVSSRSLREAIESSASQQNKNDFDELISILKQIDCTEIHESVTINMEALRNYTSEDRRELVDSLEESYKNYEDSYNDLQNKYNVIVNNIASIIQNPDQSNIDYNYILSLPKSINNYTQQLDANKQDITTNWKIPQFINALNPYRSKYINKCISLKTAYSNILIPLENAIPLAQKLNTSKNSQTTDEFNTIMSHIYLLGIDQTIKLSDLITDIDNLLIEGSKNSTLSYDAMQNLLLLENLLKEYNQYSALKKELETFSKERLPIVYQISNTQSEKTTNESSTIHTVTENQWKNERNSDLYSLETYLTSLPDSSYVNRNDETGSKNINAAELTDDDFVPSDYISKTALLRRDHLGELTDFERAFNYFKYGFPIMAVFSAFIALFFDLGAFFTGCFLYCTEFFVTDNSRKKADNSK